jgi:hypothetical protein
MHFHCFWHISDIKNRCLCSQVLYKVKKGNRIIWTLWILKIMKWSIIMSVATEGNIHHIECCILTRLEYTVQSFERHRTTAWLLRQDRYLHQVRSHRSQLIPTLTNQEHIHYNYLQYCSTTLLNRYGEARLRIIHWLTILTTTDKNKKKIRTITKRTGCGGERGGTQKRERERERYMAVEGRGTEREREQDRRIQMLSAHWKYVVNFSTFSLKML